MTRAPILALTALAVASLTAQALYWRHYASYGGGDGVAHVRATDTSSVGPIRRAPRLAPVALRSVTLTATRPFDCRFSTGRRCFDGIAPMPTVLDP